MQGWNLKKLFLNSKPAALNTPLTKFHFKQSTLKFGNQICQQRYFRDGTQEKNCRIRNQHLRIPLCTDFHSKQSNLKFPDQICPKKGILGKKLKKTIVKFKISSLEYSIVSSFILNKALSSFGTKFIQKKYFGNEI